MGGGVDRAQAVSRVWGVSAPCPGGRRGARARPTLLAALIIIIIIIIIIIYTSLWGLIWPPKHAQKLTKFGMHIHLGENLCVRKI